MKKEEVIRYNKFNDEYIVIPISEIKLMINICKYNIEEQNISDESKKEYKRKYTIFNYILKLIEKQNKKINCINIKKENSLYKELLIMPKKIITTKALESACHIAQLEQDIDIAKKISILQNEYKEIEKIMGMTLQIHYSDIAVEVGKEVADYIWENDSLEDYNKKQNNELSHEEDRHIFLYEDGNIVEIDIPVSKTNGKKKTKIL